MDERHWPTQDHVDEIRKNVEAMGAQSGGFQIVASPYRICPLGAHVDHQGGAVTTMALDRGVLLGFAAAAGPEIRVRSAQFPGEVSFRIPQESTNIEHCDAESQWGDLARGACYALLRAGHAISRGIVAFLDGGEGFHGCGVSSSAAVGIAFLLAMERANDLLVSPEANVELDRILENEFLGVKNGVMDQSAILFARPGCLTLIRCHELDRTHQSLQFGGGGGGSSYKILLAFSGLRHALASKPGFNLRVSECNKAAKFLLEAAGRDKKRKVAVLGDVAPEEYTRLKAKLAAVEGGHLARRAEHFFSERARVEASVKAWVAGDLAEFGRLMTESGRSSIENYECGCEALIDLWGILAEAPGVYGARFSGAGFRGFCVALVKAEMADEAARFVRRKYREAQPELSKNVGGDQGVVICDSGGCASLMDL
ncbi:galacturonokinase [Selaginella moellendorffii]|nr:galacturonokinase [Selaginella moellendorffii]|eukprot:XP_002993126.2 galacturonokinase [Selaginella moellendorffii]